MEISMTGIAAPLYAKVSDMPVMGLDIPLPEVSGGAAGGDPTRFSGDQHQHPRLTSTTVASVVTGSTVPVTFTRTFVNKPGTVFTEYEGDTSAASQPAVFKVQSWVQDGGGLYTGCVVKVWKASTLPQNLVTLLIGAVFNLFSASVVGVTFSIIAVQRSDVP